MIARPGGVGVALASEEKNEESQGASGAQGPSKQVNGSDKGSSQNARQVRQ
jgi:hypothetical protein